jgi:nicotinamidase-related amidase
MPAPFLLERDEAVLCVVDIQEKLLAQMGEKKGVIANAVLMVSAAMRLEVPLILTEQYPRGLGRTAIEISTALGEKYKPIEKMCFGCADEPAFMEKLKSLKRKQVLLCGVEAHICVLQTCLELLERKYQVQIVADAVCSRNADHKSLALEQMRDGGAVITCAEAVIFQLLGRAGTPEFKDILNLIK